jgi:hypothetical protein
MNIVFFNNPVGTKKINFLVTEKSAANLKREGIIPKKSAVLVKEYNENMSDKERAFLAHIDKVEFDNYENPTVVAFDLDLIRMFFIDIYRGVREETFKTLDSLQVRAMMANKPEIAASIEEDKRILRDMPDTVMKEIEKLDCFFKINQVVPKNILVDYKEKYGYMLK